MKSSKFSCLLLLFTAISVSAAVSGDRKEMADNFLTRRPVKFVENKGQLVDMNNQPVPHVWFKASAPGVDLYVTEKGLKYVFLKIEKVKKEQEAEETGMEQDEHLMTWEVVDVELKGASLKKENLITEEPGSHYTNHFYAHCPDGITGVKEFGKITVRNVYPGVDWVLYNSSDKGFKYDFVVHPGANPSMISLRYISNQPLVTGNDGSLRINTGLGTLQEEAPVSYSGSSRTQTGSSYFVKSRKSINGRSVADLGYKVEPYSKSQDLVIDPLLKWATFYGGNSFEGTLWIDDDSTGNLFTCGYTASINLPLVNAGTYFMSTATNFFIMKFSSVGSLAWATFYGPSAFQPFSLATDRSGNVFISGSTSGTLLPVQNSGTYFQSAPGGLNDAFILKFDNAGNRLWGTFYGGSSSDQAYAVATDPSGNVFLTGITSSTNFPIQNAGTYYQPSPAAGNNGFIVKFDNLGNRLWATYYEKLTPWSIAADAKGRVTLAGQAITGMPTLNPAGGAWFQGAQNGNSTDIAIVKFDNPGNLLWATFYGGTSVDVARSVIADKKGNVFVAGMTMSTDLPVMNAGTYFQGTNASPNLTNDAFILKFDSAGVRKWATYFGGSKSESFSTNDNLEVDGCGNVYVAMDCNSSNMPLQQSCDGGYYDTSRDTSVNPNSNDIFIARFTNDGALAWSSYIGGSGHDFRSVLAIDRSNNLFVTGEWITTAQASTTYPVSDPGAPSYMDSTNNGSDDVYLAKFINSFSSFSYQGPYCSNGTQFALPAFSAGYSVTGTFTSTPAGLSLNAMNGQVTPGSSVPGTYTVTHMGTGCDCSGTSGSPSATISISPSPVIIISGNNVVCLGSSVTRTASGASTYTWSTGAQTNVVTFKPTTTMTLTVTGTSSAGCVGNRSVTVIVSTCPGFDELATEPVLRIYPNPNEGEFIVESDTDVRLELVNLLGQKVRTLTLSQTNERKSRITGLERGVYFLQSGEPQHQEVFKIVVE